MNCEHYAFECYKDHHVCADCDETLTLAHKPDLECDVCGYRSKSVSKWETKDSGERLEYPSGMRRDIQDNKPRFDLLFVPDMPYAEQPLTRWAALLERGATKYGEANWTLASSEEELKRFKASAARHFAQWISGEKDEDHMSATFFNMAAVAYMEWKLSGQSDVSWLWGQKDGTS